MLELCFATNNENKLREIRRMLGSLFKILSLEDIHCDAGDLPENGVTLEENSLEKASFVYNNYGVSCFADDTGLEVGSLDGEPGVFSARYAGPQKNSSDNILLLLDRLKNSANRNARFRTVITLFLSGTPVQFEGIVNGIISKEKKGTQGFGYDPVFIPEGYDRSFAEMSLREKNKISHRGIAFRKLVEYLQLNIMD